MDKACSKAAAEAFLSQHLMLASSISQFLCEGLAGASESLQIPQEDCIYRIFQGYRSY